jgi:hypothetical protein
MSADTGPAGKIIAASLIVPFTYLVELPSEAGAGQWNQRGLGVGGDVMIMLVLSER